MRIPKQFLVLAARVAEFLTDVFLGKTTNWHWFAPK